MPTKKSKPANDFSPVAPFLSLAWGSLWGLADDTRIEVHGQLRSLIGFVDSSLQSASGFALKLSERSDRVTREALLAADQSGRTLALAGRDATTKILTSYRSSATQIATTTRDSARQVAERASATARVIVAPADAA